MLTLATTTRIFAFLPPTDMRKGFSGLSAIIREEFQADPTDVSLFLFINKRRDRMKLLHFAEGGFWLYYRLLEAGTFEPLKIHGDDLRQRRLDATELAMLLAGVSLAGAGVRRRRFRA